MTDCAVIGGTGLNQLAGFTQRAEHSRSTPYGEPSAPVQEGMLDGADVVFLPRHGSPHRVPPHLINYRANLWLLQELGVKKVLAVNAVGGVSAGAFPGALVVPDQIIDYTWGREHTWSDGVHAELEHIDFTSPYTASLRQRLLASAQECAIDCIDGGTYAATQGPRLESAAEVQRLLRDGCDVVGMTGMPEASLAAELGIDYAAICLVVNAAAGLSDEPITLAGMERIVEQKMASIGVIISRFLQSPH